MLVNKLLTQVIWSSIFGIFTLGIWNLVIWIEIIINFQKFSDAKLGTIAVVILVMMFFLFLLPIIPALIGKMKLDLNESED